MSDVNLVPETVLQGLVDAVKTRGESQDMPFLNGTVTRYTANDVAMLFDSKDEFFSLMFVMEGIPYMVDRKRQISFQELDESGVTVTQFMADDVGGELIEEFLGWRAKVISNWRN